MLMIGWIFLTIEIGKCYKLSILVTDINNKG